MMSISSDTRKILKKGFSSAAKAEQEVCGCEMERRAMSVRVKFFGKVRQMASENDKRAANLPEIAVNGS